MDPLPLSTSSPRRCTPTRHRPSRPPPTRPCAPAPPYCSKIIEPPFPIDNLSSLIHLLQTRRNILILGGAGMSVSCGIPDFRTPGIGLYETIDASALGLLSPEDLFDLECFVENPAPFYKFAKALYFPPLGSDAENGTSPPPRPSATHAFLKTLQDRGQLLRVYTQNVDGLEESAGVKPSKIIYAHGTMRRFKCMKCGRKADSEEIHDDILTGSVPLCRSSGASTGSGGVGRKRRRKGPCQGVMKPCITFFGEKLDNRVAKALESDKKKADAVIVIGTSLSVAPMSSVVRFLPPNIPRILINRNTIVLPTSKDKNKEGIDFRGDNYDFDVRLLGFCDDVVNVLTEGLERGNADGFDTTMKTDRSFVFSGAVIDEEAGGEGVLQCTETVQCDNCAQIVENGRVVMKCTNCFDFDLCENCYTEQSKNHYQGCHKFIKC